MIVLGLRLTTKAMTRIACSVILALWGTALPASAQTQLVPYGSPGYRYEIISGSFPAGVELPGYDDAGLNVGAAPFGSGPNGTGCSTAIYAAATNWPAYTNLVARLHFSLASAVTGATLHFGIDNDVGIYINGRQIASVTHDNCANPDEYVFPIPDGMLVAGPNLLAALAVDRGGASAFDVAILTDQVTGPATLCAESNEGSPMNLTAPPGQVITSIDFASYGTPTGTCGSFVLSACDAASSRSVVEAACLGKTSCSMAADNTTFGDPCPGTQKRLYVQASCGPLATPAHRSTWGQLKTRYH